ncbi:MAG: phosphotransferase [Lachnospiraceae bacterium]|nr:phosphotransferase [Lachnospiraceae bacterium]
MYNLTKENLTDYLKQNLDLLDYSRPLTISAVGEGSEEEDGDGFINFVFRVSDGTHNIIVKQSRADSRYGGDLNGLPTDRNELEYDSMMIRKAIVPEYIPELYFIDHENSVFVTEDVSYLRIMRFQLIQSKQFDNFTKHITKYMAAANFYTSEYYLETADFRDLSVKFMNDKMRNIMDIGIFLVKRGEDDHIGRELDPDFARFARQIVYDPQVLLERYKLRHLFVTKGECLIHGDLHTSNIFLGEDDMKIIDMEYTFCGPLSYDLGYLLNNFIAQYTAAAFRPFESEEQRREYQSYILRVIHDLYTGYCAEFIKCWNMDAKDIYKNIPGLQEDFVKTTLSESFGFAASANLSRCAGSIPFPDFDAIENPVQKHNAMCLSIIISKQLLLKRCEYDTIDEIVKDIVEIEAIYKSNITEW